MNYIDDNDSVEYPEPICMHCGALCDITEEIYTGDLESYKGIEVWCYCKKCRADTFHAIKEITI